MRSPPDPPSTGAPVTPTERRARGAPGEALRRAMARLFDRMHRLAEAGWATTAVATWNLLQASLLPGPVEALYVPLGLADPPRVWRFAAGAMAGSLLGGTLAYGIGAYAFESVGVGVLGLVGMDAGDVARTRGIFDRHGWTLVFLSTLTPISTKLVSIAAGAFGVAFLPFLAGLALGRGLRLVVLGLIIRLAGHRLERWLHDATGFDAAGRPRSRHTPSPSGSHAVR